MKLRQLIVAPVISMISISAHAAFFTDMNPLQIRTGIIVQQVADGDVGAMIVAGGFAAGLS